MKNKNIYIIILYIIIILFTLCNKSLGVLFYTNIIHLTLISIASLFFLSIQYASNALWAKNILQLILSISYFIPIGGSLIIVLMITNYFGLITINKYLQLNTIYTCHVQKIIFNPYFYIIRNILYIIINTYFIKTFTIINKKNINNYKSTYTKKSYKTSILFLVSFYIISTMIAWDWIMFINVHWTSSIFAWYLLSSYLVSSIALITILFITYKKNKLLQLFYKKKIELINLSKYIFSGSLLWGYLWICQFLLLWYSNIPEEIIYFIKRYKYNKILMIILTSTVFIPFILLIQKKAKFNINIIYIVTAFVIIGHYLNIYYIILPEINQNYYIWELCLSIIISNLLFYLSLKKYY